MGASSITNRAAQRIPPIIGVGPGCPKAFAVAGSFSVEVPSAVHGLKIELSTDVDVTYGFQILGATGSPQVLTTAGVSTWAVPSANCGASLTKQDPHTYQCPTTDRGQRLFLVAHCATSAILRLCVVDTTLFTD